MLRDLRAALVAGMIGAAALASTSCGRWQAARSYRVASTADPAVTYDTVLAVLKDEKYAVVEQNDAERRVRVRAHVDESSKEQASFITLRLEADQVKLEPSGYLVRPDGSIHKKLGSEMAELQANINRRLGGPEPSAASAAAAPAEAAPADAPPAWSEPAYDPKTWGPGNFTCIPAELPKDEQGSLGLRLSNGENADVALSVAYAPELCRSPSECKLPSGCPALGIGDSERVKKLAERISRGEIATEAVLVHRGKPVARIDLARHGSIAQSMSEPK